jgi:uncharacterized protein YgiM (DUF1202 family)
MEFAIVSVPAAPVRRKPKHQREMVNQLLFGEAVKVLNERGKLWVKVRSLHDNYEGWMTRTLLEEVTESEAKAGSSFVSSGLLNTITVAGAVMHIPAGSLLPAFDGSNGKLGKVEYSFEGNHIKKEEQQPGTVLLEKLTMQWLNAPYLWGGRTILGVDCSGFVQVNYRMLGIDLPRDAWQQAQEGSAVKKLKEAQAGDLAFFDDKEEIVHVGILLGNDKIIHASGRVRIDSIDKRGITSSSTGERTHQLKAIRRYW